MQFFHAASVLLASELSKGFAEAAVEVYYLKPYLQHAILLRQ